MLTCPNIFPNSKENLYTFVFLQPISAAAFPTFQIEKLEIVFLILQVVWAVVFVSPTFHRIVNVLLGILSLFFFFFFFFWFYSPFNSSTKPSLSPLSRDSFKSSVSLFPVLFVLLKFVFLEVISCIIINVQCDIPRVTCKLFSRANFIIFWVVLLHFQHIKLDQILCKTHKNFLGCYSVCCRR